MALMECTNPDCPRHGISVDVAPVDLETGQSLPVDVVVCGACGQPITDIRGGSE